jgi:hypothetical protein
VANKVKPPVVKYKGKSFIILEALVKFLSRKPVSWKSTLKYLPSSFVPSMFGIPWASCIKSTTPVFQPAFILSVTLSNFLPTAASNKDESSGFSFCIVSISS